MYVFFKINEYERKYVDTYSGIKLYELYINNSLLYHLLFSIFFHKTPFN